MATNDYIVYGFWLLLPAGQVVLTIYYYLEYLSKNGTKIAFIDGTRQSVFLLICLATTFLVEYLALDIIQSGLNYTLNLIGVALPGTVFRLLLFPLVLVVGARLAGGTKEIDIPKNPLLKHNRLKREGK